ncbi:f-box domain-containing protein [Gigaspora margarita]|uniref:F-box domain-containing protein n=1 Tax=Gigaspora margarita TaxID=4874 RepID=A0A8H4EUN4_GIGMA|nr:f-box domain-containing protein [Gigaspora margarita]
MILLPNECFFKIFDYLKTDYSLFSCLLVNRHWCRLIVPILWSEPTDCSVDKRLIRIYLLSLNVEEQTLLIPFNIILPNYSKPLFEYASYTKSVGFCLHDGVKNWLNDEGYIDNYKRNRNEPVNAVKCSLIAMFLRTSKKLKILEINGTICNKMISNYLYRNTTISYLNICTKTIEFKGMGNNGRSSL